MITSSHDQAADLENNIKLKLQAAYKKELGDILKIIEGQFGSRSQTYYSGVSISGHHLLSILELYFEVYFLYQHFSDSCQSDPSLEADGQQQKPYFYLNTRT